MEFVHPSGSTITLASDGSFTLKAVGDLKLQVKAGKVALAADRGSEIATALKARMHADKLTARLRSTVTASDDDDADPSKKWEGIAAAIISKLGSGSGTVQQIADMINREVQDTETCLQEMEAQGGAMQQDGTWKLGSETAGARSRAPAPTVKARARFAGKGKVKAQ